MIILLLQLLKCIVECNIVLRHMLENMKYGAYDFVLSSVSVIVGDTVGDEEEAGWQPISAISLQQILKMWQFWWQ